MAPSLVRLKAARVHLELWLILRHRSLIWQLILRDVSSRYKNSAFGALWLFVQPLLQLLIYSFVFGMVLQARWDINTPTGAAAPFGIVLFVGLLMNTLIADALVRGPSLVSSNPTFVKRVIFPLEALPLVSTATTLLNVLVGFVLLIAATLLLVGTLPLSAVLIVLPVLALTLTALGLAWLLSALGVYFPDLSQLAPHFSTILLFTAPICYPADMVPEHFRWLLTFNPLTVPVEVARQLLFEGTANWTRLAGYTLGALTMAGLGAWAFNVMRKGFADVL